MPGPQRVSGEAFAVERLREDPNLDYATLRSAAIEAGVSLQPIHYGRARRQLGLPALLRDSRERPADAPSSRQPGDAAPEAQEEDVQDEERDEPGMDEVTEEPAEEPTEPANDIVAPRKKGSAAFDFLLAELRREPNASYGELRDRAAANKFTIAPIMYGRAKAVLGLVPVKARGSRKAGKVPAAPAAPRRLTQVESVAADRFARQLEEVRSLEQLVSIVKDLDAERRRLRNVLERVVEMIDEALG